jgi:hypothetical protein
LSNAKPGSDAAAIFERLGLSVKDLKQLDPAEALQKVATAFAKFRSDGDASRALLELTGKSLREIAPLMKDLAEQTELVGSVTKEQAEQAERFVHALGSYEQATQVARRALLSNFLTPLTDITKAMTEAQKEVGTLGAAFVGLGGLFANSTIGQRLFGVGGEGIKQAREQAEELKRLTDALDTNRRIRDDSDRPQEERQRAEVRIEQIRARLAELSKQASATSESLKNVFNPSPEAKADEKKPGLGDVTGDNNKKKIKDASLTAEQIARLQLEAEEQAAKDAAEAWKFWQDQQLKNSQAATDAEKLMWKQIFEEIDRDQERAIEAGKAFLDKKVEEVSEFAKQARRNVQDAVGDTLLAGIEGRFEDIDDLWRNLLRKMVAEALAANINEALFGKQQGGGLVGTFLQAIGFAGGFADGGFIPPGQWGWTGERGPEPVFGGSTGVTVMPNSGGVRMGDIHISVDARTDQAQVAQIAYGAARQAQAKQLEQLRAMGVL